MKAKTAAELAQEAHWFENESSGAMACFVHAPDLPDSVYLRIERNDDGLWVGRVKENHMHDHCHMVHEGTALFSVMQNMFKTAAEVAEQGQQAVRESKEFAKSVKDIMHKLLVTKLDEHDIHHLAKWLEVGHHYTTMTGARRAKIYTTYKAYPYAKDLSAKIRESSGTYGVWVDAVVYTDKPNLGYIQRDMTTLEDAVECALLKLDEFANSERHIPYSPPSVREDVLEAFAELLEAMS